MNSNIIHQAVEREDSVCRRAAGHAREQIGRGVDGAHIVCLRIGDCRNRGGYDRLSAERDRRHLCEAITGRAGGGGRRVAQGDQIPLVLSQRRVGWCGRERVGSVAGKEPEPATLRLEIEPRSHRGKPIGIATIENALIVVEAIG